MNWKRFTFLISALAFSTACSDSLLDRREKPEIVSSTGLFCADAPNINNQWMKFLFVIDKSGSNNSSDPNNAKRADNIEKFWQRYVNQPRMKWGYIKFNGDAAEPYIAQGGGPASKDSIPGFSEKPADMEEALRRQRQESDGGSTPYKAALALARQAIKQDMKAYPEEDSTYMVFFMSDGEPTDYSSGDQAVADVEEIMSLKPGRINLSTAYYNAGTNNQVAISGLEKMAEAGRGKFVNLNKESDFDFENLVVGGVGVEPWIIKNFLVYNITTALCFNNTWGVDSDSDGLCDTDEIGLKAKGLGNYDPQNRYSFGDAYGDYFHYMASLHPDAKLPPCNEKDDDDDDLLNNCEEFQIVNHRPHGTEKTTASRKNPDTDGDGFLDGIEYFTLREKGGALDNLNVFKTPVGSPLSIGEAISLHRNPRYYDAQMPPREIYDTKIEFRDFNSRGQACFSFSQKNLPLYKSLELRPKNSISPKAAHTAGENVVLVYFIQTPERDPSGPGVYMSSFQKLKVSGNAGLQVDDGVFSRYRVPEE